MRPIRSHRRDRTRACLGKLQDRNLHVIRQTKMSISSSSGTRVQQRGAALLGLAGGMLVVAGGFAASYYVVSTRSEARAATRPTETESAPRDSHVSAPTGALAAYPARAVEIKTATVTVKMTWADLGIEIDP